jgi:DNA-binding transcriptional ArsR family regulator
MYIYTYMYAGGVFGALADPTRRRIVEALRHGEQAVNDLVELVDLNQPGVSRHLRILHEAGFVQVRPDAQKRFYSLRSEPFRELDSWLTNYRVFWEARLDHFAKSLDRKPTVRRKGKP